MKTKKIRIKQLFKLHLLKLKIYEQSIIKTKFNDYSLNKNIVNIKKVLQIIFEYNQAEKRILFIGFPRNLEQKINQFTKHVAIHKNFNTQGIILNFNLKLFKKTENLNQIWSKTIPRSLFPKLSKKLDLIVLFDHEKSEAIVLEAKTTKTPVIYFGINFNSQNLFLYHVEGNFRNMLIGSNKNIFSIFFDFLFKKNQHTY